MQDIRKVSAFISFERCVDHAVFVGLLKVDWNLSGNLGEGRSFHVAFSSLLEEKILCLCQTKIAAHSQRFFWNILSVFTSRKSWHKRNKVFEDPCWLLEELAGLFDAFTVQVHVACLAHLGYCEVEKTRHDFHLWSTRLDLFLGECTIPRKARIEVWLVSTRQKWSDLHEDCQRSSIFGKRQSFWSFYESSFV